ncbi:MAG: insulinase family protein, partial [Selenomonas sp.]|nr:insulinase family protein [Selenomonas sp.]
MKINDRIHGFKVINRSESKETSSVAWTFEHEKSGARLFFLENDDDNKVFSISFRTPPVDDTGVAHIVEHSTLCGSRKYPLKEPFVELVKGSLNTFLNAMTYPDKTMYPVASRNDKDFQNLMDVYLDAVFYPYMLENPQVLMQEGWHYEIEKPEAPLVYSGVVYNEMKGALSAPDDLLESRIMAALYPDTTYGYESGGDPEAIPSLTYEMFKDFHQRYYHPNNS